MLCNFFYRYIILFNNYDFIKLNSLSDLFQYISFKNQVI